MPNQVITNVDLGDVAIGTPAVRDGLLVHGGAGTIPAGTILGTLTASGLYTPFVVGGSLGAEVPTAVLQADSVAEGAGNEPIRPIIAGEVVKQRLIIAADGDDSNVDALVRNQLQDTGIVPVDVDQLAKLDNQP